MGTSCLGGANTGLMKVIATQIKEGGSKLIGILIPVYKNLMNKNSDEIIIAKILKK